MDPESVKQLYSEHYAADYDERFLEDPSVEPDTRHEESLIATWVGPGTRWLDVACGTGHFLSRHPEAERAGIDLSPGMLARAREAAPNADLRQHDFREPLPEFEARFDLVSLMWYAYGYVDSMAELERVVGNLAAWTAQSGRVFVPLSDPELLNRGQLSHRLPWGGPGGGEVRITALLWSFVEGDGSKHHHHLLAPQLEVMRELFEPYFSDIEIHRYPPRPPMGARPALIATGKRDASR